jgi:uncharacterized protein (TIGR03083 family)
MTEPVPGSNDWLAALNASVARLAEAVTVLTPEEVTGPSYDTEWTISQVLSHLGSGAEIFGLFLRAGLKGEAMPPVSEFESIWEVWNAKSPSRQASDALAADRALLDHLDALEDQQREKWRLDMMGHEQRFDGLLRLRLGEHALHTWDVEVVRDPTTTVAPDAVALLIDTIDQLVERIGRPTQQPLRVLISTDEPRRHFLLHADTDGTHLRPGQVAAGTDGNRALQLPAEALIRLVYGRLDPQHTPELAADHIDMDAMRRLFPGF